MTKRNEFTLSIRTSNAAFQDGDEGRELARILREVVVALDAGHVCGICRDVNGNGVGTYKLS